MRGNVLFERALPLSWTVVSDAATTPAQSHNQMLFELLDHLDEPIAHTQDVERANELSRLEAKLNVIMQMLSQLLQQRQSPPASHLIRFTSDSLAWQVDTSLAADTLLHLRLHPDVSIPLGLNFVARVLGMCDNWLEVDMHGLHEDELAIWSRWVFRQHRRQVAQARQSPASPRISQ